MVDDFVSGSGCIISKKLVLVGAIFNIAACIVLFLVHLLLAWRHRQGGSEAFYSPRFFGLFWIVAAYAFQLNVGGYHAFSSGRPFTYAWPAFTQTLAAFMVFLGFVLR